MIMKQMIKEGEIEDFVFVIMSLRISLFDESNERIDVRDRGTAIVRRYFVGESIHEWRRPSTLTTTLEGASRADINLQAARNAGGTLTVGCKLTVRVLESAAALCCSYSAHWRIGWQMESYK